MEQLLSKQGQSLRTGTAVSYTSASGQDCSVWAVLSSPQVEGGDTCFMPHVLLLPHPPPQQPHGPTTHVTTLTGNKALAVLVMNEY